MDRSRWSRWTDLGGHDGPIRVVTMLRRTQNANKIVKDIEAFVDEATRLAIVFEGVAEFRF